jgi:transcriptional regulator with XRE-family HTH domain
MNHKQCDTCHGTGLVRDHVKTGAAMKLLRKSNNVSLREMARRLNFSAPYISDLEHGNRNWTDKKIADYQSALSLSEEG